MSLICNQKWKYDAVMQGYEGIVLFNFGKISDGCMIRGVLNILLHDIILDTALEMCVR